MPLKAGGHIHMLYVGTFQMISLSPSCEFFYCETDEMSRWQERWPLNDLICLIVLIFLSSLEVTSLPKLTHTPLNVP